jgi:hypothetical protein
MKAIDGRHRWPCGRQGTRAQTKADRAPEQAQPSSARPAGENCRVDAEPVAVHSATNARNSGVRSARNPSCVCAPRRQTVELRAKSTGQSQPTHVISCPFPARSAISISGIDPNARIGQVEDLASLRRNGRFEDAAAAPPPLCRAACSLMGGERLAIGRARRPTGSPYTLGNAPFRMGSVPAAEGLRERSFRPETVGAREVQQNS